MDVPALLIVYSVVLPACGVRAYTFAKPNCTSSKRSTHMTCAGAFPTLIPPHITALDLYDIHFYNKLTNYQAITNYRLQNVDTLSYIRNQFQGYLPPIRLTRKRTCRVVYSKCSFINKVFNGLWSKNDKRLMRFKFKETLSRSTVVIQDSTIGVKSGKSSVLMSFYNATELSFINISCPYLQTPVTLQLHAATAILNILDTSCPIQLNFVILSRITAINLTGSVVSEFLDYLNTDWLCSMAYLISLDISHSYLNTETMLDKNKVVHKYTRSCIPAIQRLYARNIIPAPCEIHVQMFIYMSCIQVKYSKCCWHVLINCINPKTLESLDLAENNIEYIDDSFTNALVGLRVLDISSNLLHKAHGGAGININGMTDLTEFYCSKNGLRTLSTGIYDALPNLTVIDLSFNKLESITFRIQHLYKLRLLNLYRNELKVLESSFLAELTNLLVYQKTHSVTSVKFDLDENPLICSCATKYGVVWLLDHKNDSRFWPLSCELDGNTRIINKFTIESITELCRKSMYVGIASLLWTVAAAIIIISSVTIYRHQLGLRRQRRLVNLVRKFKEDNTRDRFPVFLSFSSSNADFVMKNVFDELNTRLKELLGINRRCVAIGDADFRPGALVIEEMIRCISMCDLVIVCVSNDFLRSPWCTDEVRIAHYLRKAIILMFLEDVDRKLLAKSILLLYFSAACRSKWTEIDGQFELKPEWHVFCNSLVCHICENTTNPDEDETTV